MTTAAELPATAHDLRTLIRLLAQARGLDLTAGNIQQIMIDNPDMNHLRIQADEWSNGYRRTADEARSHLTKAQRHSWAACGPYRNSDGKINPPNAARSNWLCWLQRRANNSLALTLRQRTLIAAERHHMTLAEWDAAAEARANS
jgi:hypothetical protein